jgi:amidohydrolase
MPSDELTELRHHLHSIAEVSGEENDTADFIEETLKTCEPDELLTGVGGTGIVARFGSNDRKSDGPKILIRCELDALPIAEDNELEYISKTEGVGHKCGHDGHMAILCGVAKELAEREKQGEIDSEVILLFQPAEETGKGAEHMLNDEKFSDISPDYVFALHNVPGYKKHQIVVRQGPFAAASVGFKARLKGETSHAAHPEEGRSPALAVAQLIQQFSSLPQFYVPLDKAAKATVSHAKVGEEAFGISPGYGEVMATLRTYDNETLEKLKAKALEMGKGTAQTFGLDLKTHWDEPFTATINDKDAVDIVRQAANENNFEILEKEAPFSWSEDFGRFTAAYKGALFGLGSGIGQSALHAANYDFPDDIIQTGVEMFMGIIEKANSNLKL